MAVAPEVFSSVRYFGVLFVNSTYNNDLVGSSASNHKTSMHSHRQWQGRTRSVRIKVSIFLFFAWSLRKQIELINRNQGYWKLTRVQSDTTGHPSMELQLAVHVISIFSTSSFVSLIESELIPHNRGAIVCFNWICAASDLRSWQQKQQVSGGPDKNLVATSESRLEGDSSPWENSTLFSK